MPSAPDAPVSAVMLDEGRGLLADALAAGQLDAAYVAALSDVYDRYFRQRLQEWAEARDSLTDGFALAAVGGYGRRELCPASDIDVLLLFPSEPPEWASELARFLFFPLWDRGVELGHGVRAVPGCLELAGCDPKVLASLVDLRFLAGDAAVVDDLAARLEADCFPTHGAGFVGWLAKGNEERGRTYGDAGGMLEPDLKNGLGGLRDWHQVRWLMRLDPGREVDSRILADDLAALEADARFVLTARMHLHRLCGRKNDKLYFEFQERVAEAMGFGRRGDRQAVERFLSLLLRRMADIKALRQSVWPLLAGHLGALDLSAPATPVGDGLQDAPEGLRFAPGLTDFQAMERVMPLFAVCAALGKAPSHETMGRLRGLAGELGRLAEVSPRTGRMLYDSLSEIMPADVSGAALDALSASGVLEAILPQFARVKDNVSYDVYHVHPVGRHSLEATRLLAALRVGPACRAKEMLDGLPRPELAYWGLLLHDVGKGLGGAHAEKGAQLAEDMLSRLSAPPEARHMIAALVREHLTLPDTATGRDLSDRDVVARAAGRVATVEALDMLVLIARCDGLATGPQAWTGWKESLVFDLYGKLRAAIEQGRFFGADDARIMLAARDSLREAARDRFTPEALEALLLAMPPRYLVSQSVETILGHLDLLAELDAAEAEDRRMKSGDRAGRDVAALTHKALPGGEGFTVTVAARQVRGLFPTVTGVLALHDLSIHEADVFRWEDGVVVLSLRTGNPPDVIYSDEVFARVTRAVRYALCGKLFLAYRLAQKRGGFAVSATTAGPKSPPEVAIDNKASDLFTVIDVSCDDRVGLLYDIARTLAEMGLETHLAKVMTPAGRVRDVFYVRGPAGRRVEDPEQLAEIKAALLHRLADDLCPLR